MPKLISGWTTCCFLLAAMSVCFCLDIDSLSSSSSSSSSSTEVINDEAMTPILESEHQPWNDNYPLTQEDNGQRSSPSRNDLLQNEDGDDDDDSGNEEQDDNVNINRNRNNNKMIKSKALHHQSQAKEPERAEHVVQQNYQFDWKFLNERKRSSPPSHLFAASSFGVGGPPRRRLSLNEKQQQQSKYNNNNNNNNNNNKQLNQYAHIADSRKMIAGGGGGGGVAAAAPTALLSEDTMDSSMEVEPSVLPLLGFHSAAVQYNYNRPNDAIIKKILRQAVVDEEEPKLYAKMHPARTSPSGSVSLSVLSCPFRSDSCHLASDMSMNLHKTYTDAME